MEQTEKKVLMQSAEIAENIEKLASLILSEFPEEKLSQTAFVGIQAAGVPLAKRLSAVIAARSGIKVPIGTLDITMYRDDIGQRKMLPAIRPTDIPFGVDGKIIILTDDVIQSGRSIRAALDAVSGFGRPALIRLAVLIDRGMREYPISPDYTAVKIESSPEHKIMLTWGEEPERDAVYELPRNQKR